MLLDVKLWTAGERLALVATILLATASCASGIWAIF
jgi:hypothetical protein